MHLWLIKAKNTKQKHNFKTYLTAVRQNTNKKHSYEKRRLHKIRSIKKDNVIRIYCYVCGVGGKFLKEY